MSNTQIDEIPREPPRWGWWLGAAGFVAVILVVGSMLSPYVRHQLSLSVFRQNSPYTQFGFTDAPSLPTTAVPGKKIQISFFVTNDEGKAMQYQYVVASGSSAKLATLTSSSNTVAAGETWNVNVGVVPKCSANTCQVQISLPQQAETIDFKLQYKITKKAK